jgi:hypothetical protein
VKDQHSQAKIKQVKINQNVPARQTAQKRAYAPAFGLLAATVGILAGGSPLPMIGLGLLFGGLYLLAEQQGWLLRTARNDWRDYGITAIFSALVAAFVLLTGGAHSPMPCALYLPVLMASLCYGMELGLAASATMVLIAALLSTDGHFHRSKSLPLA